MNERGKSHTRVLCVGTPTDVADDSLAAFDVRHAGTAADARALLAAADSSQWTPDCVVSAVSADSAAPDDALAFLQWVDERAPGVATVLAPGDAGSERLASRAVAAGVTRYCPAGDSLGDVVEAALDRDRPDRTHDSGVDRRYRTLAENLPNGAVALYDRELRYLVVGGTVFDDLPLDRDRLEGARFEAAHSDAYVDRYGPLYRAALDGEHSAFEFTYEGHTFRGYTVPVRDRSDTIVAGMALTQDVTEACERQARLERQNERLDRFASVVSHDLRNPLNIVEGSLVLLREAARDGDVEVVDENADRISRACRRMNEIVDNVLTLARQPELVDDPEDVPLADTARRVWEGIDAPRSSLRIDTGTHDEVFVRADRSALARLLENLLANAVEHGSASSPPAAAGAVEPGSTSEGGVSVRVEWFEDDDRGFAVADDGPGLDPAARERAFDWGYTTGDGGLGLGLNIVESVAEAHGWRPAVAESASGGARFEIRGIERAPAEADD
ncbi:sensor histidine kinase [Salinigranum halophilum]|uniref:sensor histidine kinase n=1 Tax=Salinigranum halophilum TaxID=2565931 RepID=UPI0010A7F40F|nr:PAS domain-containing sensor histidine kinase [Salinigranum halophilum]